MLRSTPPGEDATRGAKARAVPALVDGMPPGEDAVTGEGPARAAYGQASANALEVQRNSLTSNGAPSDFLQIVSEAEEQALLYTNQANRRAWSDALKAYHNEHFSGSKYNKTEYRNRSKLFVPKTRSAIRKDMAAVSASLFGSIDAVNCSAGNEADPKQRAGAAVMQELVNYRTDRTSGKASMPWFLIAMGARQDATLTGICLSKQYWKLELKQSNGRWRPEIDRPDIHLFAPENYTMDPAADWLNPAQSAAFLILKYPMRINEIEQKQKHPIPQLRWKRVSQDVLDTSIETAKYDQAAIRRARESGLDRFDETQTGYKFKVIWVFENFVRMDGEDWHFWSVSDKAFLTDPRPVGEVYPEQFGERPVVKGYGAIDAHRIFPMAPADSWRPLQTEINDIRNLALDATKQNVMPITKIVRGRQIDVDQVKRRSHGSSIIVNNKDDVTWEQPPQLPNSVVEMNRELELEFDDLAGQFNGGTTENNNALSRTLGGLKLVAGSANAVQEFDIRVWITTWGDPVLAQLVRLEQHYESDPIVLGLCGERAQLFQKYGIDRIDDDLLEQEVTIRVSIGLGAGDPQARLAKFSAATQIAAPLLAQSKEFQNGEWQIDPEAVMQEVYGAAGYRDGGMRFIKKGQPQPNPMGDLPQQLMQANIEKAKAQGKSSLMTGLAALAKVELGDRELEAMNANQLLQHYMNAHEMGVQHAHDMHDRLLAAADHGHRHGLALRQHDLAERQHGMAVQGQGHQQDLDHANALQGAQDQFHQQGMDRANFAQGAQDQEHQQGMDQANFGRESDQQAHDQHMERANFAKESDQQSFDQDNTRRQQKFDQGMAERDFGLRERVAMQPKPAAGGGGGKKPPSKVASGTPPKPAPRPKPQPQDNRDVEQKLDAMGQRLDQLTHLITALVQQQQKQPPSFPAQPYGQ
jgi:hypothetical protein